MTSKQANHTNVEEPYGENSMFYSPPPEDDDDDDEYSFQDKGKQTDQKDVNTAAATPTHQPYYDHPPTAATTTATKQDDDDDDYEDVDDDDDEEIHLRQHLNQPSNAYRKSQDDDYHDDDDDDDDEPGHDRRAEFAQLKQPPQSQYNQSTLTKSEQPPPKKSKSYKCCACCRYRPIKEYCLTCYRPTCEFRGICGCPHGKCYGIMGVMTAMGGYMMNLYILGTCSFNRIKIINPVTGEPIPGSERGYGFDARETNYGQTPDYHQCTYYPQEERDEIYDGWIRSAKMFAYISAILGTIGFLILFSICCMAYSKSMFERWLFWLYIIAAITVCFSYLVFGSEFCQVNQCKVADGCGWALSAFFFHLLAANSVKNFPSPQPRPDPNKKRDQPPTIDDVYEELYYDHDGDKYPPPLPDGQKRGVILNENGDEEFDDGEDYFDEFGNYLGPDKKKPEEDANRRDIEDGDDGSEYTYETDDDEEFEESEYDSDEEEYDTWKKRQEKKREEYEERQRRKEEEKQKKEQQDKYQDLPDDPYSTDEYESSAAPSTTDDDRSSVQRGTYEPPPYGTSRHQPDDDEYDPLSGIPYADPYSSRKGGPPPLAPEDRVFPLDDDENRGNLGVGYEHLDHESSQEGSNNNNNNKTKSKKVLYGAPSRPNIHEPTDYYQDDRRDHDDDDDDDGPVMA